MGDLGARIRLTSDGDFGRNARLELNGEDISAMVYSVTVRVDADDLVRAEIGLYVSELEIDAPARVLIENLDQDSTPDTAAKGQGVGELRMALTQASRR